MRAVEPDVEALLDRDGVKVGYEVYNAGEQRTLLLTPYWSIVPARAWKMQIPYLSRHFRVVAVDARGAGRSDTPTEAAAYADTVVVGDLLAALDEVGAERAALVGHCLGAWYALLAVSRHPDRALGVVALNPTVPRLTKPLPERTVHRFDDVLDTDEGWAKDNRHYWRKDFPGYLRFYFDTLISEPHSTKAREDCVGWGLDAGPEPLLRSREVAPAVGNRAEAEELLRSIRCPVLVVQGDDDRCIPCARSERIAELTDATLVTVVGGGHLVQVRNPIPVNRWIRDFVDQVAPAPARPRRWTRPLDRPRRVLYSSSPIGLGHARRDLAIVESLRRLHPDLRVDWLAQHPVTAFLGARGESVHPASAQLASESAHVESAADEHDLHAFQAIREMDEILAANFGVFADLVEEEHYDLWVGDEAWDLDYFLHENPELKRTPYAWITDFVGWLPMPDGGPHEAAVAADYNAEMIEQRARLPRLRDLSLFVGTPDDVVADRFGAGLPSIRSWTEANFAFAGYVTGVDPAETADREALRADLGWRPDERVCVVTVGGTGVGAHLLRRAVAAYGEAARRVAGLRMVVVTGPRIDPGSLTGSSTVPNGVELHAYLPDLHRWLAACDVAVVQGGLTTTMELTAAGRPFLYVPLRHHFEQTFHVPHRLARYGAGRRLDYADTTPERLAAAIADDVGRPTAYRPVETDGADRAAAQLSALLSGSRQRRAPLV